MTRLPGCGAEPVVPGKSLTRVRGSVVIAGVGQMDPATPMTPFMPARVCTCQSAVLVTGYLSRGDVQDRLLPELIG
jgi:hypothetical protein